MPHYTHPPITEAVIELRLKNSIDQESLEKIATKLNKKFYPDKKVKIEINFNVEIGNTITDKSSAQLTPQGFRLSSADQADVVIISSQSFIVSRLAPYPGWDFLFEKFNSAWKIWRGVTGIQEIDRIGLRYINRIDIPNSGASNMDLEEFLNFNPNNCFFPSIPMSDYLIQVTKETQNPLWTATVISTRHPPALLEAVSLILDIDIYRTQEIPIKDSDLYKILIEARDIKNSIFTQCITKKTEELFS